MIVTLDGRRLDSDFTSGCTLMELIDRIREEQLNDRLVVSVAVNGHTYGESELGGGLATSLPADAQVDLESGDRATVAADALRGIAAELEEAGKAPTEIADRLNAGDSGEAIREVGGFIRIWNSCTTAIAQCGGLMERDLTAAEYDGHSVRDRLTELVEKLGELRDALEARDMVMLADLMHYEMPGLCDTWCDLLTKMATDIEQDVAAEV